MTFLNLFDLLLIALIIRFILLSAKVGLQDIGSHSLRKTFGFWNYELYKDVAILQEIFNHSSPSITLRYIGITEDMKNETIIGVGNLFYEKD